jgi:hypothetical protein
LLRKLVRPRPLLLRHKAEPEQQGKDTIKKVETYNPASTPANVRAPSAAEPSVDIVDTVATVAAVKPAKRVREGQQSDSIA